MIFSNRPGSTSRHSAAFIKVVYPCPQAIMAESGTDPHDPIDRSQQPGSPEPARFPPSHQPDCRDECGERDPPRVAAPAGSFPGLLSEEPGVGPLRAGGPAGL